MAVKLVILIQFTKGESHSICNTDQAVLLIRWSPGTITSSVIQKVKPDGRNRMKQLVASDLNAVLAVGRTVLECDNLQDLQNQTFRLMEDCVGASSGVYLGVSRTNQAWKFESGLAYGVPNSGPEVWCTDYRNVDPFVSRFLRHQTADDHVVVSTEVMSHNEFIRTKFYREFLRPQSVYHIMILGLVKNGLPIGLFGLHRAAGTPAFSESDATKANLLSPYLSAAVQKIHASNQAHEREQIIRLLTANMQCSGVIILDSNGSPICEYGAVTDTLQSRPTSQFPTKAFCLPTEIKVRCDSIRRKLGAEYKDEYYEEFELKLASGHLVNVHIHPYNCGPNSLRFLVYFGVAQTNGIDNSQLDYFELTPRQIDIAKLVSLGLTNLQIADNLCISARTVQNHLRSIYVKVNVHNRTSLVSRLVNQH